MAGQAQRFANGSERILTYVAIGATFLIMVLTTTDAIGRYIFNYSFGWIYDISEKYLMVLCVFMAAAYGYRKGVQIRVMFFVDRLPKRWMVPLNYVALILSIGFCLLLMITTAKRAIEEIGTGAVLGTVNLPLWPAYVVVPVGLIFMLALMVLDLPKMRADKTTLAGEDLVEDYLSKEGEEES